MPTGTDQRRSLTLDELIEWLVKLRKGQEGTLQTNIDDIRVIDSNADQGGRTIKLS